MGKNNKKNNRSLSASSSLFFKKTKNKINGHKMKSHKRKKQKSNKKIQQLFEKLRNESSVSSETVADDTVIELTENNMRNNRMVTPTKIQSRKTPSLIVINDDDDIVTNPCREPMTPRSDLNSSPIHSSTPNRTKKSIKSQNSTKEINRSSFLTIDLTTETLNTSNLSESQMNTVIDLVNNTDTNDCTIVSQSSSMSGDSQVTVIRNRKNKIDGKQMQKFISGIGKLSSTERGKLLEVIAQKIFNDGDSSRVNIRGNNSSTTKTAEDAYIKEVILGQKPSRNSIGSNIYNPQRDISNRSGLRMVVIDGSNVAMQHSMGRVFSVKGLKICIEYFVHRGHVVKAFVPQFRCQYGKSTDGKLLDSLERQGLVVYTPSRKVKDKLISSYDDRYIVQCAAEFDGVIVSRDNYRDLLAENPRWRSVIENRLLQFTWVGDLIMFPRDPLGRNGPTLEEFLRHPPIIQHPSVL